MWVTSGSSVSCAFTAVEGEGIGCGLYVLILGAGGSTEQEKAERTEYHFCCHNLDELRWMMTTWSRLSRGPKWLVLCTYDAKV